MTCEELQERRTIPITKPFSTPMGSVSYLEYYRILGARLKQCLQEVSVWELYRAYWSENTSGWVRKQQQREADFRFAVPGSAAPPWGGQGVGRAGQWPWCTEQVTLSITTPAPGKLWRYQSKATGETLPEVLLLQKEFVRRGKLKKQKLLGKRIMTGDE